MSKVEAIEIGNIRIDGNTQARAQCNELVVSEYAELLRAGSVLPPVTVFFDGVDYWLADGFHRIFAHQQAEITHIMCAVRNGTNRDATLFACGANASHGLRRTNADKRKAITMLLNDAECVTWSDSELARKCKVSDKTVASVRGHLRKSEDVKTVMRGDKTYQQNTKNIGVKQEYTTAEPAEYTTAEPAEYTTAEPAEDTAADAGATEQEALADDYDLVGEADSLDELLQQSNEENAVLHAQVEALKSDDTTEKLAQQLRANFALDQRLQQEIKRASSLNQELRYFSGLLRQVREILGVEDNRTIISTLKSKV